MIYVQRIYDSSLDTFVYYSLGEITTTPDSVDTSPQHGGVSFLVASTHVILQRINEGALTVENNGVTISSAVGNINFTGDITMTEEDGSVTIDISGGGVNAPIAISPTSLSVSQNDYNPTDFGTSDIIRLTSSASVNLTGLAAPTLEQRTVIILINVGSNSITLVHQSLSSTTTNRLIIAGASNLILSTDDAITLGYDATTTRWRII